MLIIFDLDTFTYGCPVRMATSWVDAAEAGQLNEEHGTNLVCRYLSFLDNSVVNPGNLDFILFFPLMFILHIIVFLILNLLIYFFSIFQYSGRSNESCRKWRSVGRDQCRK